MSDARASESRERQAQIALLGASAMAFAVQNPDLVTESFLNL
jgi:hypothetical protein